MNKKPSDADNNPTRVVVATLNVNGLPSFRQNARAKALLLPYRIRHVELCRQLEASDIDVLNLQEVFTHRDRRLFERYLPSFKYAVWEVSVLGPKGALVTLSRLPLKKVRYESFYSVTKQVDRSNLPALSLVKSALKGVLVSKLESTPLTIFNAHPLANDDWDWSSDNRFHGLQEAQLGKLGVLIREAGYEKEGAVALACDLNVAKDSQLFRTFIANCNLEDAFLGDQAPTFLAAFLESGQHAPSIDVILASDGVVTTKSRKLFEGTADADQYEGVYLTDHVGQATTLTLS